MEKIVNFVERAAGTFLAAVALLVFAAVVSRQLFGFNIPDNFDFSRYLQGVAIFWGLAVATYRNAHIMVDLLWELSRERGKRIIDICATAISLAFLALFAWMVVSRLPGVISSHQLTSDLKLPIWPFYLLATLGVVAAAIVALIRLIQLARGEAIER